MLIEVKETRPAPAGKKMAAIIAMDGQRFEIYPEKLDGFHVGKRYEAQVEDREWNGRTLRRIVQAEPANGVAKTNGHGPEIPAAPAGNEAHFVATVLSALIMKGEVTYNKRSLFDATQLLRALYGTVFEGRPNGGNNG